MLQATQAQFRREATSNSSSSDSSSEEESSDSDSDSDSNSDSKSDSNGNNPNLPDVASQSISPARLRADVESRLVAFKRDQDATLHQFQANNHRQRRLIAERTTADLGRLNSAVDDLRRRLVENQADLRDANRAIRDLRGRVLASPIGTPSPPRRAIPTPSPPRIRETRSNTPSTPRVVFQHLTGLARSARENAATANVAPILSRECEGERDRGGCRSRREK